jgi:hypothetical protein
MRLFFVKSKPTRFLAILIMLAGFASMLFELSPPSFYSSKSKSEKVRLSISATNDESFPVGVRSAFEFTGGHSTEGAFSSRVTSKIAFFVYKIFYSHVSSRLAESNYIIQSLKTKVDLPTRLLKLLI